jgi:hypothetical protein
MRSFIYVASISVMLLLAWSSPAWSHNLSATVKIDANQVRVKALFDDGSVAPDARVVVRGQDSAVVFRGTTDSDGLCLMPVPRPGRYQLEVNAGGGHLADIHFTIHAAGTGSVPLESNAPQEEEFTRFPWVKSGVGVGVIGLISLALLIAIRHHRLRQRTASSPD